jgi:hypothetical protein
MLLYENRKGFHARMRLGNCRLAGSRVSEDAIKSSSKKSKNAGRGVDIATIDGHLAPGTRSNKNLKAKKSRCQSQRRSLCGTKATEVEKAAAKKKPAE